MPAKTFFDDFGKIFLGLQPVVVLNSGLCLNYWTHFSSLLFSYSVFDGRCRQLTQRVPKYWRILRDIRPQQESGRGSALATDSFSRKVRWKIAPMNQFEKWQGLSGFCPKYLVTI